VCVDATVVQAGDACDKFNGDRRCADGLSCGDIDGNGPGGPVCYAAVGVGGDCSAGNVCGTFLVCDQTTKTCRTPYSGMCPP
jgi:hypothetical protein